MRIEIRNDSVLIDGYVNAVERESRPVPTPRGTVVEKISSGTFKRALERAEKVDVLLDHNEKRNLGDTNSNLKLFEDNIGLRAIVTITDPEVIEKARNKQLKGWSFGMRNVVDSVEERSEQLPLRTITELDLVEVSIIDERMTPCYIATSIETRADGTDDSEEIRATINHVEVEVLEKEKEPIDYSKLEERVNALQI